MLLALGRGRGGFDTIPEAAGEDAQHHFGVVGTELMEVGWSQGGGTPCFPYQSLGGAQMNPDLPPAHCRWEWGGPWGDIGAVPCQR